MYLEILRPKLNLMKNNSNLMPVNSLKKPDKFRHMRWKSTGVTGAENNGAPSSERQSVEDILAIMKNDQKT